MLRESLGLTDAGMRNFKRGVFFCALANLVLMAPLCVLFLLVAAFFDHLVAGAPLPDLAPYAAGCVAVVAVVAVTQALEYRFTYGPVYQESTRKREAIAEQLRRLPLSFFGKRDLSDLTSTIMKDCADQERMFMHVMPQLFGTGISTLVMAVGIVAFDWRLGIAAFWPVPVAFAIFAVASRAVRRKVAAKEERRLAMADGVQEYLDCAQEIRATNQERAFLRVLGDKLDEFERSEVASELLTGASISSSQAVLKLGIASVVLVGAGLMVSGQVRLSDLLRVLAGGHARVRPGERGAAVQQRVAGDAPRHRAHQRPGPHALHGRLVGVSSARLRPFFRGRVVFLRGKRARA